MNQYNRHNDVWLRGWTRKQPARAGVNLIIVGVLLLVVALVALAVAAMPRPAHGAANVAANSATIEATPQPLPTAQVSDGPDPRHWVRLPLIAREP